MIAMSFLDIKMFFRGGSYRMNDFIVVLGVLNIMATWLDISDISTNLKKCFFVVLLFGALYGGCEWFPQTVDFPIYNDLYFMAASDEFVYPEIEDSIVDYGFLYLWTTVKSLGGDIYISYFFTCLITLLLYYFSITRYTKFIFSVWALIYARFFFIQNVLQIRQGLACVLVLFALRYVYERKLFRFVLLVCLASLFHKTVIVAIFIYPLSLIAWNRTKIIITVCISVVLAAVNVGEFTLVSVVSYLGIGAEKVFSYAGSIYFSPLPVEEVFIRGCECLLVSLYLIRWKKSDLNNTYVSMLVLGILFLCIFKEMQIFSRMVSTFLICLNFATLEVFNESKKLEYRIPVMIIMNLLTACLLYKNYMV